MLENVIPDASVRKPIYQVFAALGLLLGAIQVGFATAEAGQPMWLTVSLGVYAFLGSAGFLAAQAKTDKPTATIEGTDFVELPGKHSSIN